MNFPVWELHWAGGGLLIAAMAVYLDFESFVFSSPMNFLQLRFFVFFLY